MRDKTFVKYKEVDENKREEDEQAISTPGLLEKPTLHLINRSLRDELYAVLCVFQGH